MTNDHVTILKALRHAYQRLNELPHNYAGTDFQLLRAAIRLAADNQTRLRALWCQCAERSAETIYMPDNVCACGEGKHHYHCPACRGISQVG